MFETPLYIILKEKALANVLKSQIYYKKIYKYERNLKRLPHLKKIYKKELINVKSAVMPRRNEKEMQEKKYIITPFTEDKKAMIYKINLYILRTTEKEILYFSPFLFNFRHFLKENGSNCRQ